MRHEIILSVEEYTELVDKQNEPSKMLTETLTNYKTKLDEANKTITDLERELSYYIIGGAKRIEPHFVPINTSEHTKPPIVRKPWQHWEIERLRDRVGNTIESVVRLSDRSESAIRSKLNTLHIFVVRGVLTKGDKYDSNA